jgi:hypothetical protein
MRHDPAWKGPGWVKGVRFSIVDVEPMHSMSWEEWVVIVGTAMLAAVVVILAVIG